MVSKTCEYAIRAMIFIAQKSKNGSITGINEIADKIGSPKYFIAKVLQDLVRKELVQSLKGPTGGFYIAKEQLGCSLADIVKAVDGNKLFSGCGLGLKTCSETKPCPIHNKFIIIRKEIYNMLQEAKIGEVSKNLEKNLTFLRRK
ncbi:MAG TPA: Rrf2 family transcriptional regulator [Hanamia sp.]